MPIRILIVDDSYVIRNSLRGSIERSTEWQVCGEAENGKIALQKVTELRPNLVILDLSMPVMNGLEAARQITCLAPKVPLVMFTMHVSAQLRKDARAAGIREVISKSDGIEDHLFPRYERSALLCRSGCARERHPHDLFRALPSREVPITR